jgi:hypothetical protein
VNSSRHFHRVLGAITHIKFKKAYMPLPDASMPTPSRISSNPKFSPWFDNCLASIDGVQINCHPSDTTCARYRNYKGGLTQNILAAVDLEHMLYVYVLSGWEGSASDSAIWHHARGTDLVIPDGKFYIADAGFPLSLKCMIPYRATRYHLREFAAAVDSR